MTRLNALVERLRTVLAQLRPWLAELGASEGDSPELPASRRVLMLVLYLVLGPTFVGSLLVFSGPERDSRALLSVSLLLAAAIALLVLRQRMTTHEWIFTIVLVPGACSGIGYLSCGLGGDVYLVLLGAPIAWAAALFEAPVVVSAVLGGTAVLVGALGARIGTQAAVVGGLLLLPAASVVAAVVFGASARLRVARREIAGQRDRLARSERQLSLVLEGSNDGFWDLDLRAHRFAFSKRCYEMVGESPRNALGSSRFWWERVHPDDANSLRAALWGHLRGESARLDVEYRVRSADGNWKWIRAVGMTVERGAGGEPVRIAGTLRDLTARREAQEQLRAALARNEGLVAELRVALQNVKTLHGLLPICAWCKSVRNDAGYWQRIEAFVESNSNAQFSHGLCPECFTRHFREQPEGGSGQAPAARPP